MSQSKVIGQGMGCEEIKMYKHKEEYLEVEESLDTDTEYINSEHDYKLEHKYLED